MASRRPAPKSHDTVAGRRKGPTRKGPERVPLDGEAKIRTILGAAPDMLFLVSRNGTHLDFIPRRGDEPAMPPTEFFGRNVHAVLPGQVAEQLRTCIAQALEAGAVQVFEYQLSPQWAEEGLREYEATILPYEKGEVMIIVRSITERKNAEERFRLLLEALPDAIVAVDGEGKIALVNAQTERLFGYSRVELLGQPVEMLVPEPFRSRHPEHRERYAAKPHLRPMHAGLELYGRRKDGTEFPVDVCLSPLETEDGVRVLSTIRDITDRKQARAALQQAGEDLEARTEHQLKRGSPYGLTFRERTVLTLVAKGLADKEIAVQLAISPYTVHKHIGGILLKMGAGSRTEAGVRAAKEGLLE